MAPDEREDIDLDVERGGGGWGTGVAGPDGRLLWVDDAFCAILGRPREELVSAGVHAVMGLDPGELDEWETGAGMIRLPAEGHGLAYRLTNLAAPRGRPWAIVIELESGEEPADPAPVELPAVFALHRRGTLAAMWGRTREVLGLTSGALGRRLANLLKEDPLISVLIRRTLRGEPTTGLFVGERNSRQVHLFPVVDPDEGTSGVLGVAWVVSGLGRDRESVRGRGARDVVLGELALMAMQSAEAGPLLEAAARLLHRALDAESCAVSEYLPGDGGLLVRASVGMSPAAPQLVSSPGVPPGVSVPVTAGLEDLPDGALEVPIGGPHAFGRLAVRLRPRRRFSPEDKGFVLAAAEIVSAAVIRLAADEDRKRAALHDPLTGLPRPTLIHDHLRQALARSRRQGSQVGLLVVDLDGFKMVNDTLGRNTGDELLVAVAQRLLTTLRPSDSLGRLDGDQFMVVCEDLGGVADARAVAARLVTSFQKPFHLNRSEVSVTASVGVSLAGDATDPYVLRAEADAAMHRAKLVDGPSVVLNEGMRPTGAGAER